MNKEIAIGFRCGEAVKHGLDKLAQQERRSISSMIEIILYKHLKDKNLLPADYDDNH